MKKHKRRKAKGEDASPAPSRQAKKSQRTTLRKSSPKQKYFLVATYAIIGAAVALTYLLLQSQLSPTIEHFFDDKKEVRKWRIQGQKQAELTLDGLQIRPQNTALLVSPQLQNIGGDQLNWSDFPYVRLRVAPYEKDRHMALVWIVDSSGQRNYHFPFTMPAITSEALIDVRQDVPWEGRFDWTHSALSRVPLRQLGLLIENPVEIRELSLLSGLGPVQLARLLWSQYWAVEPIKVSSINLHFGNQMLGVPLAKIFGVAFAALFLLTLISQRREFRAILLWAMFACFALPEVPFVLTLWTHARASSEISAWHADRHDEYRSRFGKEFADLDNEFRNHVPVGTRVAFPGSKRQLVLGETNWLWFLYYGLFDNYKDRKIDSAHLDRKTEYVFYYYPSGLTHDEEKNLLHFTGDKNKENAPVKTQTIARITEEAKILKVLHD